MRADAPRESAIVRAVLRRLAAEPVCYAEKRHGSVYSQAGAPDVAGCLRGRAFYLEVKRPGGPGPTLLQELQLERRRRAGAVAAVVRSVAEAEAALGLAPLPRPSRGHLRRAPGPGVDPGPAAR